MSKALIKSSGGRRDNVAGIIPAACSAVVPGLGQLINGDTDKAIGVFVVAAVSGAGIIGMIPLIGPVAGLVWGATWLYGVADGFLEGRKKR
jgi:TM2 domain-containing membrane protein YozV